jgi:iron complex transport system ATP-binding protein
MINCIDIKNITIGYDGQTSLISNQNLSLKQGEFVALVGRNGSGKSSLLRTIANFQSLQKGQIFINDQNHDTITAAEFAKLVSVVLTEKMVMGYATVFDVVASGRFPYLGIYGRLKDDDKRTVEESLSLVGMRELASKTFDNLSDGQQQKVILAKALAQETPYILLDEPMAFLDLPSKMELSYILHDLAKNNNKGIIISTHDLDLAMHTCNQMWLLNKQQVIVGMPEDIALQGYLGEVFDTNAVTFNKSQGHFEFATKKSKQVEVVNCESAELFWLSRALHRNGFEITEDAAITLLKVNDHWEVKIADSIKEASSITEVIELLK